MKRILEAKKAYDEIEIPQELSERVESAIEKSSPKRGKGFSFYAKNVIAPLSVCAVLCLVIGIGTLSKNTSVQEPTDEEASFAVSRAVPEPASGASAEEEGVPAAANAVMAKSVGEEDSVEEDATSWFLSYDEYISSDDEDGKLPLKQPIPMEFCSGAGAWGTKIELSSDGSFTGHFSDSNMGEIGDGYPGGTHYFCSFNGKFTNIKKIDENAYTMTLETLEYDKSSPREFVEGGIRYIKSSPYGVDGGEEFVFYLPDTHPSVLTDEERGWWLYGYFNEITDALHSCALINKKSTHGFFSDPFKDR